MTIVLNVIKYLFTTFLIVGLLFSSGVFSVLLYAKMTGKTWFADAPVLAESAETGNETAADAAEAEPQPQPVEKPTSAMLSAPMVKQLPELPAGCEIASLTMLLHYYGVNKDKMELVKELKKDPTPIKWGKNGQIVYWGNPNTGYVGDITGKSRGFGVYHAPLFELLKSYVPTAIDMTSGEFEKIEQQIAAGVPVLVWTTIDYNVPSKWVTWDTPIGPIQTTFMEHAVLLVGYDDQNVYVNDPLNGKKAMKIDKARFIATWEALGKQALSYEKK